MTSGHARAYLTDKGAIVSTIAISLPRLNYARQRTRWPFNYRGRVVLYGYVSEAYGGQGLDYISYIIAVEEIARVDGSHAATIAAGNSLGIGPLYYYASEEQKRKYLPKLCSGEMLWGFGH